MNFFRLHILIVTIFLPIFQLQAESYLSASFNVLDKSSIVPLSLDSEQGWVSIGILSLSNSDIEPSTAPRRWRLFSRYEYDGVGGPATLQVRFRSSIAGPIFTHPWTEGTDMIAQAYSNWFEENNDKKISPSERLYVDARLIAPPRTPLTGRLYEIVLEAWDNRDIKKEKKYTSDTGIRYAYSNTLGTSPLKSVKNLLPSKNEALKFALNFVGSCLIGDMSYYYKAHASIVRSLDSGFAIAKYKQPPPVKINGVSHIEEYKNRFDYKLYSIEQFRELFPGWFESSRPWIPGENAYLFLGHIDQKGTGVAKEINYLVFLIEPDENGEWKVVARPGR